MLPGMSIPLLTSVSASFVELVYTDVFASPPLASPVTFSGCNFGAADGNRKLLIAVTGWAESAITSIYAAGNSGTDVYISEGVNTGVGQVVSTGMSLIDLPSGTSGDVDVYFDDSNNYGVNLAIYRCVMDPTEGYDGHMKTGTSATGSSNLLDNDTPGHLIAAVAGCTNSADRAIGAIGDTFYPGGDQNVDVDFTIGATLNWTNGIERETIQTEFDDSTGANVWTGTFITLSKTTGGWNSPV